MKIDYWGPGRSERLYNLPVLAFWQPSCILKHLKIQTRPVLDLGSSVGVHMKWFLFSSLKVRTVDPELRIFFRALWQVFERKFVVMLGLLTNNLRWLWVQGQPHVTWLLCQIYLSKDWMEWIEYNKWEETSNKRILAWSYCLTGRDERNRGPYGQQMIIRNQIGFWLRTKFTDTVSYEISAIQKNDDCRSLIASYFHLMIISHHISKSQVLGSFSVNTE